MTDLENLKLRAVELSKKSCNNFQHGCLIIRNGKVIASAFNDHNGHAEHNALRNVYRVLCGPRKGQKG